MDSFSGPVFSIQRFFHRGEKSLPCWLASRFYPQGDSFYQLFSQGRSLLCEKKEGEPEIPAGAWVAVQALSKKAGVYQTEGLRLLSAGALPLLSNRPEELSYTNKGKIQKDWQGFLKAVRDFFNSEGLAEVESPGLVLCPGTEPHLQPFQTELFPRGLNKTQSQKLYLPTSPEMHLKKLLCHDWTDFFEIKKCYRNGESGPLHQPEFTLLEWYRAFYSTKDLMEEVYKLLSFLQKKDFCKPQLAPFSAYTVRELFQKHLSFSLNPRTSKKELLSLLESQGIEGSLEDSLEDLFFLIFLNKIESQLPKPRPVFIYDYPPQLRAFAQLNKGGWADRFELYWQGMELANAFYEVIDPVEQKSLFERHLKDRRDSVPMDEELISMMGRGMPPCSGAALGLDRLFLAMQGKKDLREIRLFSF